MLKTWIRRIHLTLAALAGLLLLNLSISGALLLYAKDIQAIVNPDYWRLPTGSNLQQSHLPLSTLANQIESATNSKVKFIQQEEKKDKPWLVYLANGEYLNINPYSGKILLKYNYYDTFYGFVMAWHRWLVYQTDLNNKPLKVWMSIASLALMVEVILGCFLWLKPKHRLKRLKIKWRSKPKTLFYQLHTVLGVFAAIPLILIAFSGMAFHWQPATKQVVEWLTFSNVETAKFESSNVEQTYVYKHSQYELEQAYQAGQSALEGSSVYRVYLPQKSGEPLKLRLEMPDESHAYSWSWVNIASGNVLATFDASQASLATQVWNFKYKFHIGEFLGWPVKVLWLFISLLPSFFVISGFYLLIKRKKLFTRKLRPVRCAA
ncbi:PepSY-associated TM helix domain-containing protein [Thalassotalea fusca]